MPDRASGASGAGMRGTTALITGASSGIGRAVALRLADAGANLALIALAASGLEAAADLCRRRGAEAIAIEADVSDPVAVERAFLRAEDLGPVAAVFSAAGTSTVVSATDTSDEQWQRQLSVNLTGTFNVVRAAARLMVPRRRGAIVTTASELALTGQAGYVAYSATKGGVLAMTRALAAELAPHGVRVNAVCPGTVDTPLLAAEFALAPDPANERVMTEWSIALGRIGDPDEIAGAVVFLLSDDSSYVTGAEFVVDGGRTGCYPTPPPSTQPDHRSVVGLAAAGASST
jgi:NAD(P)-dependent dehydrogenase (short-subunit alcohol dehydrogenase family)